MENSKSTNTKMSARAVAAEVLTGLNIQKHDAAAKLERWMNKTDQHARATDLVFGVIRNLAAIDLVVQKTSDIKPAHTDENILAILHIGIYELIFVPATPDYAIVNDAANLAAAVSKKSAGFVNAVLRNVQRSIQNRSCPLAGQNPRRTLPTGGQAGCVFALDILPEPEQDLAVFFSQAFSFPLWLIRQWLIDFGPQKTRQICHASNRRPSVLLRANPLKITTEQLFEQLQYEQIDIELSADKTCVKLLQAVDIKRLKAFQEGLFFVQDSAAFEAINLLRAGKNQTVLDLCSAPGIKTAVLAAAMQNSGLIYASDADSKRLGKVAQNCQRLGIRNVQIVEAEKLDSFLSQKTAVDIVIVDVPCSNTGVLARRAEARWRLHEKSIAHLTHTQQQILHKAISIVRPGGSILYSTCSILAAENQHLVKQAMEQNSSVSMQHGQLILPAVESQNEFDHDGGYAALLQKN